MANKILSINVKKDNLREVLEKIEREYKDARWCYSRKKPTEFFPYDAGCIYLYDDYDITYSTEIEPASLDNVISDNVISAECFLKEEQSNVNHPEHYQGKNECIDVMLAMFGVDAVKHFCMCNAYKYRFRADKKNGAEDIEKAEWYESKLIELGGVDDGK